MLDGYKIMHRKPGDKKIIPDTIICIDKQLMYQFRNWMRLEGWEIVTIEKGPIFDRFDDLLEVVKK